MQTVYIGGPQLGPTTADAVPPGFVGEELTGERLLASGIMVSNGVVSTVCSTMITPGHWQITGFAGWLGSATVSITRLAYGWSTVDATLGVPTGYTVIDTRAAYVPGANAIFMAMPTIKIRVSVDTPLYQVHRPTISVSSNILTWGKLCAERR